MPISGPRATTIRRLFAVSMNRCAFPGCTAPIVDPGTGTILAEVCHIHAQSTRGPRFNPAQTDEDRHAIENIVVMCRVHHKVIDENISVYSAENLREIKRHHEDEAMRLGVNPEAPESVIRALMLSATTYESGSVHMDFRQAKFQVGGEGGSFGGGGGHGGVLTIIGISRLPPGANVNLDGQNGKAPGGGGGGGGALAFQGRLSEETDVRNGLKISSLFLADAASLTGLLNILGGGWDFCMLPSFPYQTRVKLVGIVECGRLDPSTLLRVAVAVENPEGTRVVVSEIDIEVPMNDSLVRRVRFLRDINLEITEPGVWKICLSSGEIALADYKIEFRQQA